MAGLIFLVGERAANSWRDSQHLKKMGADSPAKHFVGLLHTGNISPDSRKCGHVFKETALISPIRKIRVGRQILMQPEPSVVEPQHGQAIRRLIRKRLKQDRVYSAENGGIGADPER